MRGPLHRLRIAALDRLMELFEHLGIVLDKQLRDFLKQVDVAAHPRQSEIAVEPFAFSRNGWPCHFLALICLSAGSARL